MKHRTVILKNAKRQAERYDKGALCDTLFSLFLHEVITYGSSFLVGTALERGLEEKEFKHSKHDEELDQDDDPERSAPSHATQSFGIDAKKSFKCSNHKSWILKVKRRATEFFTKTPLQSAQRMKSLDRHLRSLFQFVM